LLPSAVFEYGSFAGLILYLAANVEQLNTTLPKSQVADGSQVLKDIEKLLNFTDEAYIDVKEALPQRHYDGGEVDLLLPFDPRALEDQIEALQVVSTMILAVLQLGGASDSGSSIIPSSSRFSEAVVNTLKRVIRDLKCSQSRDSKPFGVALKRAKTHSAITEFLDALLVVDVAVAADTPSGADETENNDDEAKEEVKEKSMQKRPEKSAEQRDPVHVTHYNADPLEDGMPEYLHHNPDNVYAKVHVNDVDTRSMLFYDLPFSKAKGDSNYYIIWKPMEMWECENLFQHTKKLRINEQHAAIQPKDVIKNLLVRWMGVEASGVNTEGKTTTGLEELDRDLEELKAQDERRRMHDRPIVRERSWSPPRAPREHLLPVSRRLPRYRSDRLAPTSKTEYWRSWGGQTATLHNSLKWAGWEPIYMRGTDAGQTWFYGANVVHVRRFTEEYTPQDGTMQAEEGAAEIKEYLIVGAEWIEEEALVRHGFQFQLLPSGHYSLDSRLTWVCVLIYNL
jgi:hypothetical protein